MEYLSDDIKHKIESAVQQKFETVLAERIDTFIHFFNTLSDLREAFPDYEETMLILNTENAKKICDSINLQVGNHYQKNESLSFDNLFSGLAEQLDNLLLPLEQLIVVEQPESRFKYLDDDTNFTRAAKKIKITSYKSQQLLLKFINSILIKVKRKPIKSKFWNQKIPLRNVGYYFLRNKLLKNLSSIYHDVFKILSMKSIAFWKYDERYDETYILNFIKSSTSEMVINSVENSETIVAELELLKEDLKRRTSTAIQECIEEFHSNYRKVGTIELSKSRFYNKRIIKNLKAVKTEFNKIIREWNNTLCALGEDWQLNNDLYSTRYSAMDVYLKFEKSLSVKSKIQIYPQFNDISRALHSVSEQLQKPTSDLQELQRLIAFSRETLQKILLTSALPNLINSISDLRIPEMIEEVVLEIKKQIASIKEMRIFVKTTSYESRTKSFEMDKIYPREFVSFNIIPKFLSSLEKIKKNSTIELKSIQSELIHLGNMADFGLESAISAANKENLSEFEIKEVAFEGIKLSSDKQEQLIISFNKVCNNILENLKSAISKYNHEMFTLIQSSNVNEIRLQLTKVKAKAKTKESTDRFYSFFKNFIPVNERTKDYSLKAIKTITESKKQAVLTGSEYSITSEIYDFVSGINSAFEKLPYMYRRLFQLSPLESDRLYIHREIEENQMQLAYTSWLNGGYAPVIISAEKGNGITTFLNICLKKLEDKNKIKWLDIKKSVFNKEELLLILGKMFLPEKFSMFDELVNYLNREENRQIVVIENLQYLYLRDVKGFDCLKVLTDIISKTSKNIFWITSTSLYANKFLNKTIRINEVFGYHIFLSQFNNEQIADLVKIRNSISGYNLEYVSDKKLLRKKDFNVTSFEQKQNLLEKEFFNLLNKFVRSNVSLALLYWLGSIREIKERKVYINSDFEISNTILNSLSKEKIFVLHSLVLHDSLRISDIAKTVNYSFDDTSQLVQILYDEGVLVKNDEMFFINPLLYRQVIEILKTHNLI